MVSIDTITANGPVRIGDRALTKSGAITLRVWAKMVASAIRVYAAKQRSRMHLRELTDEQLRDIGVTREEARFESGKPGWL